MARAQVTVAHSMIVIAHHILTRDEPHRDIDATRRLHRNGEAHTQLVAQLEPLGHTVTLDAAN